MGKILSIVVPAYNVEKYLDKCLESMVQLEVLEDIEVLIINDGSIDNTESIARSYCERYPRTFFLYNKENGGHGSGINYGIRYATGKYFKVVDGDDWLNKEELSAYVTLLKKRNEDLIATDYLCIEDGSEKVLDKKHVAKNNNYIKTLTFEKDKIEEIIKMHSFTIRTDILKKNNIVIDENCYYVDCEYIVYPMPFVQTVYCYPNFIYMYRLGRKGQSVDISSMQKNRKQHENVLIQLLKFYDNLPEISEEKKTYIEKAIGQVVENQFQIYISMGKNSNIRKELKKWDLSLKEKYPAIYESTGKKSIRMLRITDYRILLLGYLVYKIVKKS